MLWLGWTEKRKNNRNSLASVSPKLIRMQEFNTVASKTTKQDFHKTYIKILPSLLILISLRHFVKQLGWWGGFSQNKHKKFIKPLIFINFIGSACFHKARKLVNLSGKKKLDFLNNIWKPLYVLRPWWFS